MDVKIICETFKNLFIYAPNTSLRVLEKVLVAFFMLNGIIVQSNNLDLMIKVVFSTSTGAIFTAKTLTENPKQKTIETSLSFVRMS
jgi:hypothetical protein